MIFMKKVQILEKKNPFFYYICFFNVITAPITLKSRRNIQGWAPIRAVLDDFAVVVVL